MITSRFYYKNLLKRAEDGMGDGSVYATATGATVDQDNKAFTLSGLSILADLGADADDKFNGFILYFPDSGNIYHIVDWTAATDTAEVFETPDQYDTLACEIRLNLWEEDSSESNPIHRAVDGKTATYWRGSGTNQAQTIRACLPNLIEDGGFEQQSAGDLATPWTAQTTQWQISATSPLLGSRMAVYMQSAADCHLKQDIPFTIEKGKTYRIMLKVQAIAADPAGDVLSIKVRQRLSPNKVIESGMDWKPAITVAAGWKEATFVPGFSSDMLELLIDALGSSGSWGSCTGLRIDEIYIYEDVTVDRLIVFGHTWNNGEITSIYGCRCWPGRTSFAYGNDASANLAANADIDQTEPIIKSLTESNYPVWEIKLTAATSIQYEAAIMFLGPQMAFGKQMNAPFDPDTEEVQGILNETDAGRTAFHKFFHRGGPYELTLTNVNSSFYVSLKNWWQEVGRTKFPFFFCFDESASPEEVKLVRCETNQLFTYNPVLRDGRITLREEL